MISHHNRYGKISQLTLIYRSVSIYWDEFGGEEI